MLKWEKRLNKMKNKISTGPWRFSLYLNHFLSLCRFRLYWNFILLLYFILSHKFINEPRKIIFHWLIFLFPFYFLYIFFYTYHIQSPQKIYIFIYDAKKNNFILSFCILCMFSALHTNTQCKYCDDANQQNVHRVKCSFTYIHIYLNVLDATHSWLEIPIIITFRFTESFYL